MSAEPAEPLISICVPTHHGRRDALAELIRCVVGQARDLPGQVEICVSDNASSDGTVELIGELSRDCPCPLLYHRQPHDTGLARNLVAAVGLARGRYCWLLGSDDLPAPGALARIGELLAQVPDATGYVVGAVHVDAEDPSLRSRALPRAFHPPGDVTRAIDGLDRIHDECGNAWCALSWSLVDRQAWLCASQRHADVLLAHPVFPQVVVLSAMAYERPRWGWLAEPLVHQRNATTFLFERGEVSLATRWTEIIGGVAAVWNEILGRRSGIRWRRRMRRVHEVWGSAADMRATKLYERPTLRSQARLALTCLKAFWPTRTFWREVLPASVTPTWLARARYGFGRGRAQRQAGRVAISGSLPHRMEASGVTRMKIQVRNHGGRSILPDGSRAVTIAQRWFTAAGEVLGPHELGVNALAALPQSLPRVVRARRSIQSELVLYAPAEPGSYHLQVLAHRHGHGSPDQPSGSQMIAGDIEVVRDRVGGRGHV